MHDLTETQKTISTRKIPLQFAHHKLTELKVNPLMTSKKSDIMHSEWQDLQNAKFTNRRNNSPSKRD